MSGPVGTFHYSNGVIRLDLVLSVPIGKIGTNEADVGAWQQVSKAVGCGTGKYNSMRYYVR